MGIKLTSKILPASPDKVVAKATKPEAALARMAHVNSLVRQMNDIAYYELDLTSSLIVNVTTSKGIIDIIGMDTLSPDPDVAFASAVTIVISNPDIPNPGADVTYIQLTPYYNPAVDDTAIPYVIATGFLPDGFTVAIFNANGAVAGADQWKGSLYLYYEVKVI